MPTVTLPNVNAEPCNTDYTPTVINSNECIGDSLSKINGNFAAIDTELDNHCTQINDLASALNTSLDNIETAINSIVIPPLGSIVMFHLRSGVEVTIGNGSPTSAPATITNGIQSGNVVRPSTSDGGKWVVCNGAQGTPDLRGRFIVSVGDADSKSHPYNATGGQAAVTLSLNEMPVHTHEYSQRTVESRSDGCKGGSTTLLKSSSTSTKNTEIPLGHSGTTDPHENRPQYYALIFIQRVE